MLSGKRPRVRTNVHSHPRILSQRSAQRPLQRRPRCASHFRLLRRGRLLRLSGLRPVIACALRTSAITCSHTHESHRQLCARLHAGVYKLLVGNTSPTLGWTSYIIHCNTALGKNLPPFDPLPRVPDGMLLEFDHDSTSEVIGSVPDICLHENQVEGVISLCVTKISTTITDEIRTLHLCNQPDTLLLPATPSLYTEYS